jgi:acyl-CoA synthetase (NDP forming)
MIPPHNPLDLLGDASPERFSLALQVAQHDMNIDAIILIVTPQSVTDMPGIVNQLIAHRGKKPLFVSLIGGDHLESLRKKMREHHIIANDFPNEAVETLGLLLKTCKHTYEGQRHIPLAGKYKASRALPLMAPTVEATFQLLKKYDFRLPKYFLITEHHSKKLLKLSYPLFAKTANLSLLHKKEVGAVFGIVENADEAHTAYEQLSAFGNEVLFQEVLEVNQEILIGAEKDPQFGWYMTFGMGGSYTNLLADRQYAFLSATKTQLKAAWNKTKAAEALKDNPRASLQVVELLLSLQKLLQENPWIKTLEINPVVVNEKGVWAADVKIQV